jgi:hypothetical protein
MTSFAKLMPEEKTSDIDCGWGPTARMTYRPRQITYTVEEAETQVEEAETQEKKLKLAMELCRVIKEWDMTGPIPIEALDGHPIGSVLPDGEPAPFDPKILSYLPQPLLAGIVLGVTLDAQPDPKGMQSRSQRRGSLPTSMKPNGTPDAPTLSPLGSTTT